MLTPPDLPDGAIATLLRERYGLPVAQSPFLPLGADSNTFAFRVSCELTHKPTS